MGNICACDTAFEEELKSKERKRVSRMSQRRSSKANVKGPDSPLESVEHKIRNHFKKRI